LDVDADGVIGAGGMARFQGARGGVDEINH
jgi:hypothetical protein